MTSPGKCFIEALMDKGAAGGGGRETETWVGILIDSLISV